MPIYEYQCSACGHQLEAFQKISEAILTECPACHRPDLNKLISASGFQLKGTGWYKTDYSSKGKPSQAEKTENGDKTSAADSKSTENKPSETKATETKSTETTKSSESKSSDSSSGTSSKGSSGAASS